MDFLYEYECIYKHPIQADYFQWQHIEKRAIYSKNNSCKEIPLQFKYYRILFIFITLIKQEYMHFFKRKNGY